MKNLNNRAFLRVEELESRVTPSVVTEQAVLEVRPVHPASVITWTHSAGSVPGSRVEAQLFNFEGSPTTQSLPVDADALSVDHTPSISLDDGGKTIHVKGRFVSPPPGTTNLIAESNESGVLPIGGPDAPLGPTMHGYDGILTQRSPVGQVNEIDDPHGPPSSARVSPGNPQGKHR